MERGIIVEKQELMFLLSCNGCRTCPAAFLSKADARPAEPDALIMLRACPPNCTCSSGGSTGCLSATKKCIPVRPAAGTMRRRRTGRREGPGSPARPAGFYALRSERWKWPGGRAWKEYISVYQAAGQAVSVRSPLQPEASVSVFQTASVPPPFCLSL